MASKYQRVNMRQSVSPIERLGYKWAEKLRYAEGTVRYIKLCIESQIEQGIAEEHINANRKLLAKAEAKLAKLQAEE